MAGSLPRELELRRSRPVADARLRKLVRGSRPLVAGPWLGEVGFELLYWIPLLRSLGVERERLTAVSRGGADRWYADVAGSYLDVLDVAEPEELREWIGQPGGQKRREVSELERDVLARVDDRLPDGYDLLHPSLMYALLRRYWTPRGPRPLSDVLSRARYAPLPAPGPPPDGLPEGYVAAKAYFSPVLPESERNREFVAALIARLSERAPVVSLATGVAIDDHHDAARVAGIEHLVTPRTNLDVQTRVVAGARALVTTYGGFAYLGPMCETTTIAFAAEDTYNPAHADVADRMLRALERDGRGPSLVMATADDVELLASLR